MDYRISELARRSGFPPSTLRYYETVGLLPEPVRTDAGYRVYDDEALERLRFIARAKTMGLALDDIAGLVGLWADGSCSTVQGRLRELLDVKATDVRSQIADLSAFAAQLDHLRATLDAVEPAERCGPGCGCDTEPESPPSPAAVPITCTLPPVDAADRTSAWVELLGQGVDRQRTPTGARVRLPHDPVLVARAADLAVREVDCCGFFSFALTVKAGAVWLDVTAPAEGRDALDSLFGPACSAR